MCTVEFSVEQEQEQEQEQTSMTALQDETLLAIAWLKLAFRESLFAQLNASKIPHYRPFPLISDFRYDHLIISIFYFVKIITCC